MAAPRVLSGVLLEAVTAWQEQIETHPLPPVASAVLEEAKKTIVMARSCSECSCYGGHFSWCSKAN